MFKLKYETGIVTLMQFFVLSVLIFTNQIYSIVTGCHSQPNDCVSNAVSSITLIILAIIWFGVIWMLGFTAQERRSRRLALLLIAAELGITLVELFNLKHPANALGFATSLVDIFFAVWVIVLAWRISRAKGGRVVNSHRARRRRPHNVDTNRE